MLEKIRSNKEKINVGNEVENSVLERDKEEKEVEFSSMLFKKTEFIKQKENSKDGLKVRKLIDEFEKKITSRENSNTIRGTKFSNKDSILNVRRTESPIKKYFSRKIDKNFSDRKKKKIVDEVLTENSNCGPRLDLSFGSDSRKKTAFKPQRTLRDIWGPELLSRKEPKN